MRGKLSDHLVMAPMYVLVWPFTVAIAAAPALLAWRAYVFLREGYWIGSICHLTSDLIWFRGATLPDACSSVQTQWLGFNRFANWSLRNLDPSLFFLSMALVCFAAGIFLVAVLNKLFVAFKSG